MARRRVRIALARALGTAARADDPAVLATCATANGPVSPEAARKVEVTIREDGSLTLRRCDGTASGGETCKTRRGKVATEGLEAIRAAIPARFRPLPEG